MNKQEPQEILDELTRRKWLLILGELTALAGFSGIAPELAAAVASSEGTQSEKLPPGLYNPSQEHLSHAISELGSMRRVPPGNETDYVQPAASPFRPQFFSDEELKIVSRIVQIVLGNVDSDALSQTIRWLDLYLHSAAAVREVALKLDPLHRTLAVAYYGEDTIRGLETADPQRVVRSGLIALEKFSVELFGRAFSTLPEAEQEKLIATISAAKLDSPLRAFYEVVKTEAVRGYYTSPAGLRELDYKGNSYYVACPGCAQT